MDGPSQRRAARQNLALQIEHHEGLSVPDWPRIQNTVRLLRHAPQGKMLDVGYSPGSFADSLATTGWDCIGLDASPHLDAPFPVMICDLNDGFPFPDGSFDLVTAGEVIEHMFDQETFLAECRRVLKPGGLLALTTPNLSYLPNRFLVALGRMPMFVHAPYHYHFHNKRSIVTLLEQAGFAIRRVTASHALYSRRLHPTGIVFEWLADLFPTLGAHLIVLAELK